MKPTFALVLLLAISVVGLGLLVEPQAEADTQGGSNAISLAAVSAGLSNSVALSIRAPPTNNFPAGIVQFRHTINLVISKTIAGVTGTVSWVVTLGWESTAKKLWWVMEDNLSSPMTALNIERIKDEGDGHGRIEALCDVKMPNSDETVRLLISWKDTLLQNLVALEQGTVAKLYGATETNVREISSQYWQAKITDNGKVN